MPTSPGSGLTYNRGKDTTSSAVPGLSLQVRCFSASVAGTLAKPVRPPVQIGGTEGRDASDLHPAASKRNERSQ